jgi:2-dehydro-3-deoxyphosphogluconate aldolase/(4S)-4-hydroxy-2-oxoglutarate aldolase
VEREKIMMNDIYSKLENIGIIPVVVLNNENNAVDFAKALYEGGIKTAEITLRTKTALKSIKAISDSNVDIIVGAGTVSSVEMAKKAIAAGAKYIVSPGFNSEVVDWCIKNNIPVIPGIITPSEIETALNYGLRILKFFPASKFGGFSTLKAYQSPYQQIKFIPTGGINEDNLNDYLSLSNVLACGGSWVCPMDDIDNGNFDYITKICKDAVLKMHNFKLAHIGINSNSEDGAKEDAKKLCSLFGFKYNENPGSIFLDSIIEVVKNSKYGTNGHIAISTTNVKRAVNYFNEKGLQFDNESAVYIDNQLKVIYFKDNISGFAIHLVKK